MRFLHRLTVLTVLLFILLTSLPNPTEAAQVCGCRKLTTGRINRITAIPPGVAPTCKAPNFELLCWPDEASSGSLTSITAGDGLQATPTNPITDSGTISVAAPMCSATTEKLLWDGTAFQCGTDQDEPETDVSVSAYASGTVSVPDGPAYFTVPFDVEYYDTANMHDNVTDNGKFFAPVDGKYLVTAFVGFSNSAVGIREVIMFDSAGRFFGQVITGASPQQETIMTTSAIIDLSAGQYISLVVTQNSGGPLDLYAGRKVQLQKLN